MNLELINRICTTKFQVKGDAEKFSAWPRKELSTAMNVDVISFIYPQVQVFLAFTQSKSENKNSYFFSAHFHQVLVG